MDARSDIAYVTLALAVFSVASVVYLLQALRLMAAGRLLRDRAIADHVGFALSTFAFCAICVVMTVHASPTFSLRFGQLNWVTGSLVYFFYVRSLRSFTGIRLRSLAVCEATFGLTGAVFFADHLLHLATNTSLLFVPKGYETPNILYAHMGGNLFSPTPVTGAIAAIVFLTALWMLGSFVVAYIRAPKTDGMLLFGALLSILGLANELALALLPSAQVAGAYVQYTTTLLWFVNLPELARITWHYHRRTEELVVTLAQERAVLERAAALSTIAGSIAHDVTSPLSVIQLRLAGLQRDGDLPAAHRRALEQISRNSGRIRDIVGGYLKLTNASGAMKHERVTCRDLVSEAISLAEPRLREYGAPPVVVEEAELAHVECQRTLVELALTNLLANAAHAVKGLPDARIHARIEVHADETHIRITDSGPGFDRPFDEVVNGREVTPRPGGHGIGLRTAKRIVESQGGRLELEQVRPTTLRVTLPRAP